MNGKERLGAFCRTAFAGVAFAWTNVVVYGSPATTEKIETSSAILTLKVASGDLVGVQWKRPKLDLIREAKLGENFRILLPRADYEANYFNSRDQLVRRIEKSRHGLVLHYGPLKNEREEVPLHVAYEIRDTGSQLQFSIEVDNPTDRPLAEVLYALIGGQQGIANRLDTESLVPGKDSNLAPKLFSNYRPSPITLGHFDSNGFTYPGSMAMGWMDVYNVRAGVGYYYANQDPETRLTTLYTEMRPYTKDPFFNAHDNWPDPALVPACERLGLTLGWVNFPYTVNASFRAGPIALQVHEGDWHVAADIYRVWFDRHFKVREPSWLRKEMAWQEMVITNLDDVILYRFNDLPKLAADARKYGVTTFMIEGWSAGGNDRGYPDFTPDARLGTREEFRNAVAAMRAIGVHTALMCEVQIADASTEAFRTRYSRYAVQGRWAPQWNTMSFGGGTIGSRILWHSWIGATLSRPLALVSPSHPELRTELVGKYLELIRDGVSAFQFDKSAENDILDFNPTVPTSPDRSIIQGLFATFDDYLKGAERLSPQVALAADMSLSDRGLRYFDVSRFDLGKDADNFPLRYTFPEWVPTVLVHSPEDFDKLNTGLRYGAVWVIAPRMYADSMDETLTRPLSRYVSELIRIRKQYADLLFHGRFNDTEGARVDGNEASIRYSVFRPMDSSDGRAAVVVVNFGDHEETATVNVGGKDGHQVEISAPFAVDRAAILPVKLSLSAHRAAVVRVQ